MIPKKNWFDFKKKFNIVNSDMRTKTGNNLQKQAEAILKTIANMPDNEKPKSFSLPIDPVEDEEISLIIGDILSPNEFLKENAFSFRRLEDQTKEIVIYVKPSYVG